MAEDGNKDCAQQPEQPECHGEICWLEIPILDVPRAQKFYTDVFGWKCSPDPTPAGVGGLEAGEDCPIKSMYFFSKGKTLNGAFRVMHKDHFLANSDPKRPHALPVLPTLHVKDCGTTLEEAEAAGGKTQWPKTNIGQNMGFYARLIDTEGNMIGLWSYV